MRMIVSLRGLRLRIGILILEFSGLTIFYSKTKNPIEQLIMFNEVQLGGDTMPIYIILITNNYSNGFQFLAKSFALSISSNVILFSNS